MNSFPFSVSFQIVSGLVEVDRPGATDKPIVNALKVNDLAKNVGHEGFTCDPATSEIGQFGDQLKTRVLSGRPGLKGEE
jgi:hypothetical protein